MCHSVTRPMDRHCGPQLQPSHTCAVSYPTAADTRRRHVSRSQHRLVSTRLRKRTAARYIDQQPPQAAGCSLARAVCHATQAPRSVSATELGLRRQLEWLPVRQRISLPSSPQWRRLRPEFEGDGSRVTVVAAYGNIGILEYILCPMHTADTT